MGISTDQIIHLQCNETTGRIAASQTSTPDSFANHIGLGLSEGHILEDGAWIEDGVFNGAMANINYAGINTAWATSVWSIEDPTIVDDYLLGANSIATWVRVSDNRQHRVFEIRGHSSFSNTLGIYLEINSDGYLHFYGNNVVLPADPIGVVGSTFIPDGEWHHVVMTKPATTDLSDVKLFVDGVEESVTVGTGTLNGGTGFGLAHPDGYIVVLNTNNGTASGGNAAPVCHIDDWRYWKREISISEIIEIQTNPYINTNIDTESIVQQVPLQVKLILANAISTLSNLNVSFDAKISLEVLAEQLSIVETENSHGSLMESLVNQLSQIPEAALITKTPLDLGEFGMHTLSSLGLGFSSDALPPVQHPIQVIEALFGREL